MSYRIEHDNSVKREDFGDYKYCIYDGNQLIAIYWHDYRGDDHGIYFGLGQTESWPVGPMLEFIEGGGPEPLRLSERAQEYLREKMQK